MPEEVHIADPAASEAAEVAASFHRGAEAERDELDMTPMVDVTFLLLIFFMVTAAFALQKSLEVPVPDQTESAAQTRSLEDIEEDDDFLVVEIHANNTIFVDGIEAVGKHQLVVQLREARAGIPGSGSSGPSNMLVLAHEDCQHEYVVRAVDAGNAVGMQSIRLATAGEDDF